MAYNKKTKETKKTTGTKSIKVTEETPKLSKRGRPRKNIEETINLPVLPSSKPLVEPVQEAVEPAEKAENPKQDEKVYNLYKGRFEKGDKRCGRKSNVQLLAERIKPEDHESVIEKMISLAKEGDPTCMKLYMERFLPVEKHNRYIKTSIKEMITLDDMQKGMTTLIKETSAGEHDVDSAHTLFSMIKEKKSILSDQMVGEIEGKLEQMKKLIDTK